MKKTSTTILSEFDQDKFLYQEFGEVVLGLIKSLIRETLNPHQVSFRLKERNSLSNKLLKKNNKYSKLSEITDVVGVRIITYFEDDIDRIADILKKEFEIDYRNSIDKRQVEADKFGYRSLHYIASLSKQRTSLTEYKKFKGLKFEVQIRSILQHSWAEIEHDLGYKGETEIPATAKRTFYRVAALLEQADIEFVKLKKEIAEHEFRIKEQITSSTSNIKIDKSAIIAFIKESNSVNEVERTIETSTCKRSDSDSSFIVEGILERLRTHKVETLKELEELLIKNKENVINWAIDGYLKLNPPRPEAFVPGASLVWLLNFLDSKNGKPKKSS